MKHKLLYLLLPLFIVFGAGCLKSSNTITPLGPIPTGTFSGQFLLLHKSPGSSTVDTEKKANIVLSLNSSTNVYSINGDTATVHAGSFGSYSLASPYINFVDKTYSNTTTQTKIHLSGIYQYLYDGNNLLIVAGSDTINLLYQLKKTN